MESAAQSQTIMMLNILNQTKPDGLNDADGVLNEELDTMFDAALQSFLKRIGSIMHWKNRRYSGFILLLICPALSEIP